jgi:S-formylglutathione hydrolase FrmB
VIPLARIALLALLFVPGEVFALPDVIHPCPRKQIHRLNQHLAGCIIDFTHNHDGDYRIWSNALCEKRDLYIYLPPGYDGLTAFPSMIWFHGFGQDEKSFLDFVHVVDHGIAQGKFPPVVIAAPDGSIGGRPTFWNNGSFFMNSKAGRFEDWIIQDVWPFLLRNYRIRPERDAHILAGASMGGYAAYALSFKHRESFGAVGGLLPALDIRYADCNDKYFRPYNPYCTMERDHLRRQRVIGKFYGGLLLIRERRLTDQLLGRNPPDGLKPLAAVNPVEMLESLQIQPGEFNMFIGYAGKDEFNLNAQTEHFLDVARRRGINPTVIYLPNGHHSTGTGQQMVPQFAAWMCQHLRPYLPPGSCANSGPADLLTNGSKRPRICPLGLFEESGLWPRGSRLP